MSGISNDPRSLDPHYLSPRKGETKTNKLGTEEHWGNTRHIANVANRVVHSILHIFSSSHWTNQRPLNNREMLANLNYNIDLLAKNWKQNPEVHAAQLENINKCLKELDKCISADKTHVDRIIWGVLKEAVRIDSRALGDEAAYMQRKVKTKDTALRQYGYHKRISY